MIEEEGKKKKVCGFIDICGDSSYFERSDNMRHYVICVSCGFIPLSMIDKDTKFLDLHCKCGNPAMYSSFTEEDILNIINGNTM